MGTHPQPPGPAEARHGSQALPPVDVDQTVSAVQGANPFIGLTPQQVARAAGRWAGALARRPSVVAKSVQEWVSEEVRVVAGQSQAEPDPKDRRFSDPVWSESAVWRRVAQSYVVTRGAILDSVDKLDLDPKSADRARFALMQLTEASAPTNNLLTNPVALRTAASSRGRSLVSGGRLFLHDVMHNGGMPSQVDTRPFRLGENTAATEGAVVYRTPMFELIQYSAQSPEVHTTPMVLIPPQINRYYFLDLAPGRSFVEHAVSQGLQVFCISWRNPTPRQRDWDLDDYAAACIEAIRVATSVTGTSTANIAGFCAGGMTTSSVLAHVAATEPSLINAATLGVTMIDADVHTSLNMFASERTLDAALAKSQRQGVLRGSALARMFAFVRPNDLIWNYVVSSYLLGRTPPAFDVLAWNQDTTNMPAALHATFLDMWLNNSLMDRGRVSVLGTPIDLSKVENDLYVVGARTDHLVPWQAAYAATQVFGGAVRFALSNSGHIQALINPPGNPKATYLTNEVNPSDPDRWMRGATTHLGSWWEDWSQWAQERSGPLRRRPRKLGSRKYPPMAPAPGTYVTE